MFLIVKNYMCGIFIEKPITVNFHFLLHCLSIFHIDLDIDIRWLNLTTGLALICFSGSIGPLILLNARARRFAKGLIFSVLN